MLHDRHNHDSSTEIKILSLFIQNYFIPVCIIFLWNNNEDILKNVYTAAFHIMNVNGDWGYQAPKRTLNQDKSGSPVIFKAVLIHMIALCEEQTKIMD